MPETRMHPMEHMKVEKRTHCRQQSILRAGSLSVTDMNTQVPSKNTKSRMKPRQRDVIKGNIKHESKRGRGWMWASPLTRLQRDWKTLGIVARTTRIEKINITVERQTQIRVLREPAPNYHINEHTRERSRETFHGNTRSSWDPTSLPNKPSRQISSSGRKQSWRSTDEGYLWEPVKHHA